MRQKLIHLLTLNGNNMDDMKTLKPGQLFTFKRHVYQVKVLDPYPFLQLCKSCAFRSLSIGTLILCPNVYCISQDAKYHYYFKLIK